MDSVRLRFAGQASDDRPLAIGVHGLARRADGAIELVEGGDEPVRLCVDRRGVWLYVDEGTPGVPVNGRHVRRMEMLLVGNTIYVDVTELPLVSAHPVQLPRDEASGLDHDRTPNQRVELL